MRDLTFNDLGPILGVSPLNLIRRCADGSLRMSADRWRLVDVSPEAVVFRVVADDPTEAERALEVRSDDVSRVTWDRLPKQQQRSQLRFHLTNGDLWTFSGNLREP